MVLLASDLSGMSNKLIFWVVLKKLQRGEMPRRLCDRRDLDPLHEILLNILLEMGVGPRGTTLEETLQKFGFDPKQEEIKGYQREDILQAMRSASGTALEDIRAGKSILRYGDRCMFFETLLILVTRRLMSQWGFYDREDEWKWDQYIDFLKWRYELNRSTTDEDVLKEGKWFYLLAIYPGCPIN